VAPFKLKLGGKTMVVPPGEHDIGRNLDCWLTLDDELASRCHARLHVSELDAEVEDLGSRNGTFLNDRRIEGRRRLRAGDRIRIGRETIEVIGAGELRVPDLDEDNLKRTLAPGEDTRFPNLMGQLVEKSLRGGKIREAERYAQALYGQIASASIPAGHPAAVSCVDCLLAVAERTSAGIWVDRVFRLYTDRRWVMEEAMLERVAKVLDRIPRVPGSSLRDYENRLRMLVTEGIEVPDKVRRTIAELADAYGES
jgi:hypothetical protein